MESSSDPVPRISHLKNAVDASCWEARPFDSFRLRTPASTDATPAGRKARALVAYLIASTDDGVSRERLAGLLWSERGEDQARASLRQTLIEIRPLTAGETPLVRADRTKIAIDRSRISTDIALLEAGVRADDAATLVALVGERPADFLTDLENIDPAFDQWLSIERSRRRDSRRRDLIAVAERRLAAGNADVAQQLANLLLAVDTTDEAAARIAMEAGHRRGDRDDVRRIFAALQSALRGQVGVDVSRESDEIYRRLMSSPGAGARADDAAPTPTQDPLARQPTRVVAADVAPVGTTSPASVEAVILEAPPSPPQRRSMRSRNTIAALLLVLAGIAGVEVHRWQQVASDGPLDLSIEPVHVATDDPAAALRVGFAAEVARMVVGQDANLVVHDTDRPDDRPTRGYAIAANAVSDAGGIHVDLRLFANEGGRILWSTTFARPLNELDALREQMAVKVADVVTCAMGRRSAQLDGAGPDALRLLLGACDLRRNEAPEAARLLVRLTTLVPGSAHGWALLAEASAGNEETDPDDAARTESYARRAIALDPHAGDAYVGREEALSDTASWSTRMRILQEGAAQDPDNADVAARMARVLARAGYWGEAIAASNKAVQADPFSPIKAALRATLAGMGGDGPGANMAFHDARRRFFNNPTVALAEFRYQALASDHQRAAAILDDPDRGFHLQPERAAMWRALLAFRAAPSPERNEAAFRAFEAAMHAFPGVNPATIETLADLHRIDDAYAYADCWAFDGDASVLFDDVTQSLRADPRFMTLAARMGLVRVWQEADRWPDFCKDRSVPYDCRVEAARALSGDPRPLVARR